MALRDIWRNIWTKQADLVLSTLMPSWLNDKPAYSPDNFEARVRDGYTRNELIFACIDLKANSMASAYLRTMPLDGTGDPLINHPLSKLIERPNPFMTEFDFHSLNVAYMDLAGRAYWEKVRNRAGVVVQLWPLRPDCVAPVRSQQAFISGYEYTAPGTTKPISILPENVLEFKRWNPLNLWSAVAPAGVMARSADTDNALTDFLRLWFQHGGVPPGMLSTKQRLNDDQVTDARRRWRDRYGGYHNWFEPAVLDSELGYQPITSPLKEMGLDIVDGRSEARICMALGVPPILVGAKIGLERSTFNNTSEAEKYLWNHTVIPSCKRQRDELQSDLADSEFGGEVKLQWDYSEVPAMQEDIDARERRAMQAYTTGTITDNEYRELLGYDKRPDGDVTPNELARMKAAQPEPSPTPAPSVAPTTEPVEPDDDDMPDDGEDMPTEPMDDNMPDGKTATGAHEHKAKPKVAPDDPQRRKREKAMQAAMEDYFAGCMKRIKAEVE